jgi:hypothetical protein
MFWCLVAAVWWALCFRVAEEWWLRELLGAEAIFWKFLEPPFSVQMLSQIVPFPNYLFLSVCSRISKKIWSVAPGIELQEEDKGRMVEMVCASSVIKQQFWETSSRWGRGESETSCLIAPQLSSFALFVLSVFNLQVNNTFHNNFDPLVDKMKGVDGQSQQEHRGKGLRPTCSSRPDCCSEYDFRKFYWINCDTIILLLNWHTVLGITDFLRHLLRNSQNNIYFLKDFRRTS